MKELESAIKNIDKAIAKLEKISDKLRKEYDKSLYDKNGALKKWGDSDIYKKLDQVGLEKTRLRKAKEEIQKISMCY